MKMKLQLARVETRKPTGTPSALPPEEVTIYGKHTVPWWLRWWRSL